MAVERLAQLAVHAAAPAPVSLEAAAALLRGLNREQRRAVTFGAGPALILAGPGTGKTEVITRRVAWLIAAKRARPREILALTFTDNAASEMQARVDVLVPYGQADAAIHTFHAFGDRLLREFAFELGLGAEVRLLRRPELIVLLREHLFELGLERYRPLGDPARFLGALVDLFGRAKDEDMAPAALADHAQALTLQAAQAATDAERAALLDLAAARTEVAQAYERYTALLAERGAIDHADQVALALRLLREQPAARRELGGRFRFVLVDELQDVNRSQLELIREISRVVPNVMAVGDPDQSIYGFRGALSGNVARFGDQLPALTTIELRRNYRAARPIISVADRVREHNALFGGASLKPQVAQRRAAGRPVRLLTFANPESEADGVAAEIEGRIAAGAPASDFAVLVRSNSELDAFERSLRVRGIPVESGARARLTDVPAVRALLAFLRVVTDPSSSVELFALISAAPYELDGQLLGQLLAGARRRNRSLWEALVDAVESDDPRLDTAVQRRAARLVESIRAAVAMAAERPSGEVLYDYLRRSGSLARLAQAPEAEAQAVARFCEIVRGRAELLVHDRVPFLTSHLDGTDLDREADLAAGPVPAAVRVLTVHRAKGLEFRTVFVSGLVDGRFPVRARAAVLSLPDELTGSVASEDAALAEERRLFYVAATRARDELILTTHERDARGRARRRPSVFIAEALDAPPVAAPPQTGASGFDLEAVLVRPPARVPAPAAAADRALTLSYSQLDEYLTCPERYRLRHHIGVPTPAHHALSYGTAVHQAIAAFHAGQLRGAPLTEEELLAEYRRAWQPDGYLSREHEEARFAAGRDALLRFRAEQLVSGSTPAAVERPFSFRLGRDEIRGRVDRLDETADGAVITDYKSSDVRDQKRADTRARDSLQLQVYALAHEARTGSLPARVQLHFVETGVVGKARPDAARLERARQTLAGAADGIRAGDFEPKPNPINCGHCPFRSICRASAA